MAKLARRFTLVPTLILVSVVGSAVIAGVLLLGAAQRATAAADYTEVKGRITTSEFQGYRPRKPVLVATFTVDGKTYRVNTENGKPTAGLSDKKLLETYPVGTEVAVFHAPSNPSVASFTRSISYSKQAGMFGMLVIAAIAVLVWILRRS